MLPHARLLRPILLGSLILMPLVAVLSFRSGDRLFSASAAVQTLFVLYLLIFGVRPNGVGPRVLGLALAALMMILGASSLFS